MFPSYKDDLFLIRFKLRDDGFRKFDVITATFDIIIPVTLGLLGCLLLPILIVMPLQRLLPNYISPKALCQSPPLSDPSDTPPLSRTVYLLNVCCPLRAVLYVYPGLFVLAGIAKLYDALQDVAQSWAQQIRDSEFLLEMRLKNLDPPSSSSSTPDKPNLSRSVSATTTTETTPNSSTISINQPAPPPNI